MAFSFGASEANRLSRAASLISATAPRPLSVAFRLKQASSNARNFGVSQWVFSNNIDASADPALGVAIQGGASANALSWYTNGAYASSATWTADTTGWHGCALTFAAGSPGAVAFYRDGADITGAATTATFGGGTTTGCLIGALNTNSYGAGFNVDGSLADFAVWSAVLDADEAKAVTNGFSPLLVRPGSLAAYLPLANADVQDLKLGNWTKTGTLTRSDHPLVLWPTGPVASPSLPAYVAPASGKSFPWGRPGRAQQHLLVR